MRSSRFTFLSALMVAGALALAGPTARANVTIHFDYT